jgi:hypothetical protein
MTNVGEPYRLKPGEMGHSGPSALTLPPWLPLGRRFLASLSPTPFVIAAPYCTGGTFQFVIAIPLSAWVAWSKAALDSCVCVAL